MKLSHFLSTVVLLFITLPLHSGDKLRQMLLNAVSIESKIVLVPTILPNPILVEKLKNTKKGAEKVTEYEEATRKANENIRQYLDEYFDYTRFKFIEVQADSYAETLKSYDPKQYVVLQFGLARQLLTDPPEKIGTYYTQTFGVYDLDGETPLFIVPARQDQAYKKTTAQNVVIRLNEALHRAREKARRKGIRPPKAKNSNRIE